MHIQVDRGQRHPHHAQIRYAGSTAQPAASPKRHVSAPQASAVASDPAPVPRQGRPPLVEVAVPPVGELAGDRQPDDFGVVRVVNFAHGEMMTIAMYLAVTLFAAFGLDPLIMLVPIAAVLFALGYVMQAGVINPFISRPEHSQFMLLVAIGIIITNVLLIIFGPDAKSVQTSYSLDSFLVGPLIVDATKAYAAVAAILVALALFVFFRFTLVGKAIRACADNYVGALVVGLDVKHLYALTFGLGAACVGAAGAMLVLVIDATPPLGPALTLLAFVIVITGGLGSMPGALLGGVMIGLTEALAGLFFTPSAKSMFSFGLLVLVLLFRPQGIVGKKAL